MNKLFKILAMTVIGMSVSWPVMAQGGVNLITLKAQNQPFKEFLQNVEKQSGYSFFFTDEVLSKVPTVSVDVKNRSVDSVLHGVLDGTGLTFETVGDKIAIKLASEKADSKPASVKAAPIQVSGIIVDENNEPLPGAAVMIAGTMTGSVSDL